MSDRVVAAVGPPSRCRANAWRWYLSSSVPLAVAYFVLPGDAAKVAVWPLVGWSSVVAMVVGIRWHRPRAPVAWYLLAAGVAAFIVGDDLYTFRSVVQHSATLFPSYVDLVYLSLYPLLIGGLALLVHRRSAGRDRAGAIDASIIAASLGLLSWVLLIAPYVGIDELSVLARIASVAYPVGDVALVATAVRLAVGRGRRPLAFWLLAGSLVPLLASDALYGWMNLAGTWHEHNPVDLGWIAFYVGWGAAALHPSMAQLSLPASRPRRVNTVRLVVIGAAVLVPPAMLFVEGLDGDVGDPTAIAVVGALLLVLVLVRIAGLAREGAVTRTEARFRALVHEASDAVVALDASGHVIYCTPSTERLLGLDAAVLDGCAFGELLEETDRQRLSLMLSDNTTSATLEWRIHRDDGDWRDLEVVVADMRGTTDLAKIVVTMRDITRRKQLDEELRRQTLHDSLTGLPNRTLFLDRVGQAIKHAEPSDGSVAVLLLDLDDFKEVNDSLGHATGDRLLVAVAACLATVLPFGLTIARLGGDEFAVLLEGGSDDEALSFAALRIQAGLRVPLSCGEETLQVHASFGMALARAQTHRPDDVLREADLAMYVAKRNGKDRFESYHPTMHDEANHRLGLATELRTAIAQGELVVFYQPIVDIRTGRTRGVEALVRWRHPVRGLVGPDEFIPIAETSGLVVPLGRWVLEEACRTASGWKRSGIVDDDFYVSVNLSARHLQDQNVLDDVRTALAASGLAASALVLEVTETGLIEDLNPAGSTLAMLKRCGLRIAVDDFGTGYSSLSYLSSFPIDIIKIDKSFVDQLNVTAEGRRMVRAVVDLSTTLGLTAIAEGVETHAQADALHELGCPLAQGFLFARPVAAEDVVALLDTRWRPLATVAS